MPRSLPLFLITLTMVSCATTDFHTYDQHTFPTISATLYESFACDSRILYLIPVGESSISKAVTKLFPHIPKQTDEIRVIEAHERFYPWLFGITRCTEVKVLAPNIAQP